MEWQDVRSSNIAAVGYDADSSELQVRFKNGSTYAYLDVPEKDYEALANAASVGSYFHDFIRDAYISRRV